MSFATLFGGAGEDYAPKIAAIAGGDFIVCGQTTSKDPPVTAEAIEKTMESKPAVFLTADPIKVVAWARSEHPAHATNGRCFRADH